MPALLHCRTGWQPGIAAPGELSKGDILLSRMFSKERVIRAK
jgi:hypothetical protein